MKIYVLNGVGRLPGVGGNVTYVTSDNATLEEMVLGLGTDLLPFVLIWHEDPKVGIGILKSLRNKGRLSPNFRGCVFFRALRYAGLNTEEKARAYLKRSGFLEEVHIVSNIISSENPTSEVLNRFKIFVEAVSEIGENDDPIPFLLLEPPGGKDRRALARTVLFLAQKSLSKGLLSLDEVLASIDWRTTLRDADPEPRHWSPSSIQTPPREELLNALNRPEIALNLEPLCPMCPTRSFLEHSRLRNDVVMPGTAVLSGKWPKSAANPNDEIRNAASIVAEEIDLLLSSATDSADRFRRRVVLRMSPYLNGQSESFSAAASELLHDEFNAKCDILLKQPTLKLDVAALRNASTPSSMADKKRGENVLLIELISIAKALQLSMQCSGEPNKTQVRQP